jgi:hypothetical protein
LKRPCFQKDSNNSLPNLQQLVRQRIFVTP